MTAVSTLISAFEGAPLPDALRRAAVHMLVDNARKSLAAAPGAADAVFARDMVEHPIAEHTQEANEQHYELPPVFFERVLGPRLKYSSGYFRTGEETLEEGEIAALKETCLHADLHDGQDVLELGCGWGSLSLWMAQMYPHSRILSVSNSAPQRRFIEARAIERGLTNLSVVTADMNVFTTDRRFDRVVSVEMFEHMSNWRALLKRVRGWLRPDGALFLHVFSHRSTPYRFDATDPADWIAKYFFTGGIMPSHGLVGQFPDLFQIEEDWRWSGEHYAHTAEHWLRNYDKHADEIGRTLQQVYGADAKLWGRRWRLFFLATAGLFGHADGLEWGVSHYRLRPVAG